MNAYLLSFLLICVCVSGAPSPAENGKLQNRPNSDEKEVETEVIIPQKTPVIPRREIVSDSKRRRCENCRKLRRCKVHQMCDMCNVLCKDIDLSQLQIPEVGDSTPESDHSVDAVNNSDSQQAAKLVDPKNESAISRQSKENSKLNESSAALDDNNLSVDVETIPVDDKSNQTEQQLRGEIEKEVNTAMEEKKRKLTKDELGKIVTHAKTLHDRRANREGLLQLRSRTPSNKDSSEPSNVDSSKDKSLFGSRPSTTRSLLKPKNSSFGLRKKLNDSKQANIQDSAENSPSKVNNQLEFESVTEHTTLIEELSTTTTPNHVKQNSEDFDDVLQLQHIKHDAHTEIQDSINNKELSITPEKFSMILKSLEEKVENIADLVRNTCRQHHPEGEQITKTNSLPELNQRLSVPEEEEEEDNQPSNVEMLPDKKIPKPDEKSRHSELSPFDNGFSDFSASAPRYNADNDKTYPGTSLNTKQEEPTNELPLVESQRGFNDEDPESDQEDDSTITDANRGPLHDVISSQTIDSSFDDNNKQIEDEDEDQHLKPSILHKPIIKHHENVFDPNARNAQDPDINRGVRPLYKHKPLIPEYSPSEIGSLFDSSAAHADPHKVLSHFKPIHTIKDASNDVKTHLLPIDGKEKENVPSDASKTLHSGSDKVVSHINPTTLSHNIDKFPADSTSDNADNGQSESDLADVGNEVKEESRSPSLNQRFSEHESNADEQLGSPTSGSNADRPSNQFGMVGKIIPQEPKSSNKVMFVSSGMQLPFFMKKADDGSYQLSVDMDKLCPSCQSGMCKPAINNGETESHNKLTHKISKRDLQGFNSYSNMYKKRKPIPLEKKKLTKAKRSTNSEPNESDKYKFITYLLSDQNEKNSIENQNKIDKQYVDVIQKRIKLLNNVLKWWRSFIEDKM